ncbi:hypothetical protein BOTCAL_0823g00020 [Botryotinia calthae]|uniref:Uncharacterized protein n=1 Tax=Botryotinia calthae TaxID=38488 RepID=A0A4Y8CG50_9HELO|nr:hypothetical protein BOTCAL_0823g00020 [Botryotinia calthae]
MAFHASVNLVEPETGINHVKFSYPSATTGDIQKFLDLWKENGQAKERELSLGYKFCLEEHDEDTIFVNTGQSQVPDSTVSRL